MVSRVTREHEHIIDETRKAIDASQRIIALAWEAVGRCLERSSLAGRPGKSRPTGPVLTALPH